MTQNDNYYELKKSIDYETTQYSLTTSHLKGEFNPIKTLKKPADIFVVIGVICAIAIFLSMGIKENISTYSENEYNPSGIFLAIEILFSSLLIWAFIYLV
jgi:hypothetical protein